MGIIYCLAGPSGAGKTTLANIMIETGRVSKIITVTTRPPRPSETAGVDYLFWTKEKFDDAVADGLFFEYENVHGSNYGTLKASLDGVVQGDKHAVIILDVNGAMKLKETFGKDSVVIFMTASSLQELRFRISARNTSPDEALRRMLAVRKELRTYNENANKFDHFLVSDVLCETVRAFGNIALHEGAKRGTPIKFFKGDDELDV